MDRFCRPLGDPFSHIYWPDPLVPDGEVALSPSPRLLQILPQTSGDFGDRKVLVEEPLLWGTIRIDFFGGTEKRDADCWLIFREKNLNLAEIPVPQSKMGILTFALLGPHDQRPFTGPSCGMEK